MEVELLFATVKK